MTTPNQQPQPGADTHQQLVRTLIRRAVFKPCNSRCTTASVEELAESWWFTDNSDPESIYIHACRWSDRTYHRVWPRKIHGYTCRRLEMKNRVHGGMLFWLYDANTQAEGRVSRTLPRIVGGTMEDKR